MNRKEILETAIKTVCEERQDSYGKPEDNFAIIADLWSGYLGDVMLKAEDVAIMMILLKIARIRTGKFKPDNYIDIAGYAACAAEVAGGTEVKLEGGIEFAKPKETVIFAPATIRMKTMPDKYKNESAT